MCAAAATRGELHLGATAFQPWRALLRAMDGARCGSDAAMRQTNAVTGAIGTQRRRRDCSKLGKRRGSVGFCRRRRVVAGRRCEGSSESTNEWFFGYRLACVRGEGLQFDALNFVQSVLRFA